MARFSDEQIRAIVLGPKRAFRRLQFPGRPDVTVAIRALSEAEIDQCRIEAQVEFLALCKRREWSPERAVQIDPLLVARIVDRQMIWRAYFDVDTIDREEPDKFFPSVAHVAELDSVTITDLTNAYVEHQNFVSPARDLDAKEVDELIGALGKGQPEAVLNTLGLSTLKLFTLSMARRLSTSPIGKSSTS